MDIHIHSTRFGRLTVDERRVITFPNGLLGFPDHTRFALVQAGEEGCFFWLQSLDEAALAFIVTDPGMFFPNYQVPLREETQRELRLSEGDAVNTVAATNPAAADSSPLQLFVICNRVGDWLTGNLLGPLVVHSGNRLAQQVVLTEKKWTTRQPLMKLQVQQPAELPLAKSA